MYRPVRIPIAVVALVMGLWLTAAAAPPETPSPGATPTTAAASPSTATASPAPPPVKPTTTPPPVKPTPKPTETPAPPTLQSAVSGMSKLQALIEFYYMNTGAYPVNLDELSSQYNSNMPKNGARVALPLDPATNKPFVYQIGDDGNSYSIKLPNPDTYGVKNMELTNIDWGWMKSVADEHRRDQLIALCSIYIKGLANALDQYARDNKNTLPDSLDALVPKYVKKLPTCPVDGKPYIYRKTPRGYEIGCPDPHGHDLDVLEYSSTEGFKRR